MTEVYYQPDWDVYPPFPRTAIQYQPTTVQNSQKPGFYDWSRHDIIIHNSDIILSDYLANKPLGNPTILKTLKTLNPNIRNYVYVTPADYAVYISAVQDKLKTGFDQDWLVKAITTRQPVVLWTNESNGEQTNLINITKVGWRNRIVELLSHPAFSRDGGLDGAFFDWATGVGWLNTALDEDDQPRAPGGLDFFGTGVPASEAVIDAAWKDGYNSLADAVRNRLGLAVAGNGGYDTTRNFSVDGMMLEDFMVSGASPGAWSSWASVMQCYSGYTTEFRIYPGSLIMHTTRTTPVDSTANQKAQRFALASSLLFDGAVCLNTLVNGAYETSLWIDECGVDSLGNASRSFGARKYLGRRIGHSTAVANAGSGIANGTRLIDALTETALAPIEATVWRADFVGGVALVNPHSAAITVTGLTGLKYIKGLTDPSVNTGAGVPSSLSIPARSGLVLLRVMA
jgi:hypothetical protein